ncbi:MAG: hypothetical protein VKI81_00195 [Synechococcaceae cyanobacterium]|nr:hypothetical protein [Synechococcaceae cyanobacterium]
MADSNTISSTITTPGGSTIEPARGGGYRVCDPQHHCRRAASLWEAQQLVQWAEVHHRPLQGADPQP